MLQTCLCTKAIAQASMGEPDMKRSLVFDSDQIKCEVPARHQTSQGKLNPIGERRAVPVYERINATFFT